MVTIDYFDCDGRDITKHDLSIDVFVEWTDKQVPLSRFSPRVVVSGPRAEVTLTMAAGVYWVMFGANGCSSDVVVAADGNAKRLFALGDDVAILDGPRPTSIQGTLPTTGMIATLVLFPDVPPGSGNPATDDRATEFPLAIVGNTYYGTRLHSGNAIIRIYSNDRSAWLNIPVGTISVRDPLRRNVTVNVTWSDMRRQAAAGKVRPRFDYRHCVVLPDRTLKCSEGDTPGDSVVLSPSLLRALDTAYKKAGADGTIARSDAGLSTANELVYVSGGPGSPRVWFDPGTDLAGLSPSTSLLLSGVAARAAVVVYEGLTDASLPNSFASDVRNDAYTVLVWRGVSRIDDSPGIMVSLLPSVQPPRPAWMTCTAAFRNYFVDPDTWHVEVEPVTC
ncbi:MAG TPA: hypothetical protein VIJ12_07490 [Candidatus Baltobacteraceae bacterium]